MTINILAFGIAREIVGSSALTIHVAAAATVEDLKDQLQHTYARLQHLTTFSIAVNGAYASPATVLQPGDEVAIIPPVSGG